MKQALRILVLLLLLPLVAGFGLCGLFGVLSAFSGEISGFFLGILGIAITIGLGTICRNIFRALRDSES